MALYDDLVDAVAIHVAPCPETAIYDATRHVVRDFCKESRIWVFDCDQVILNDASQSVVLLDIPEESTVIHVWGIEGRCGVYSEDSHHYFFNAPNKLQFNQPQSKDKSIFPLVSLMPSMKSSQYPDFINEYFCEGLISGVVSYLQLQPYREWSQPNAAAPHHEKYQNAIAAAKCMRDNGLNISKVNKRVKPIYM